ncbi:MAG: LSU ribosomal protein L9P [Candidatus Kaiserbacteria bacterium GW2011_GWC2_49_12]|uniref:Large ribosomal subunit protein bL9 n=3 Tax=Candidatus Kaiseribacteriota TaxID=1752734 RepID=A0A0G1WF03_9BACT|nr:MAG: LSU ribosomal protein L9P [Candidatus Kaiserbacteria bacterium GW2011_GWC2_49_12]KKW17185.1 MAG: LSU ribosomal protein L9P [Candidatus Kaiserbacteria bacterium GW2011_GWB1_50_17]OGG87810.1 MAG: 50S ribosomal protein L9 [Candidatus Kaiserbacteria bacterium RIFCSPLOWO2_12_FULL_50_28]HCM43952.1 50S ribosomal protein L9 [Candidatus Kaiserbacteria bacterium]
MKIILLKDVRGVGQRGEIKDVADGYVQNMLIPRGLVEQATPEKLAAHEAAMARETHARALEREKIETTIKSLEGKRVEIGARATEKGGLFKAIGAKDIVLALGKEGSVVPEEYVQLKKPLKEIGEHTVELTFGDARARVTVVVKTAK